jgi:hypothetical protein
MSYTEFYCQSGGSNLNSGSTASDSATYTATNGGWDSGTSVFTPASGNPSASVAVGDFASVYVDGASVAVFVGRVTAVSSTTITVSASASSGTAPSTSASGRSIRVGGAWKGPNGTSGFPLAFVSAMLTNASANAPRVNLKNNATYQITATITAANAGPYFIQGYASQPGDGGRATIDGGATGSSFQLLALLGTQGIFSDLIIRHNGDSGVSSGIALGVGEYEFNRVTVANVRGSGFNNGGTGTVTCVECEAYACGAHGFTGPGRYIRCVAHHNLGSAAAGFSVAASVCVGCIADSNVGHGFLMVSSSHGLLIQCVAAGNGVDGVNNVGLGILRCENTILATNGRYGVNDYSGLGGMGAQLANCAFYGNVLGAINGSNVSGHAGTINLTGNPFVNPAAADFSLNNLDGAGALCRHAARGSFTTSGY